MASGSPSNSTFRFGLFEIEPAVGKLRRNGAPVKLQDQPFRVLCLLLDRPGEVVNREELRQALWPADTYVEFEGSLNAALKRLRAALGDNADNPTFIETVPKRGYRFIAPVSTNAASTGAPSSSEACVSGIGTVPNSALTAGIPSQPPRTTAVYRWGIALAILALAIAALLYWPRSSPVRRAEAQGPPVIAVLPFRNEQQTPDLDFLRFAIPDDIVTDLTYCRSISVRPFASTSKYAAQAVEPETAGRDLKVTHLVSGEFLRENDRLQITLELIEISSNRAIWRKTISANSGDLIGVHQQLRDLVQSEVLSQLRAPGSFSGAPVPRNARAFAIYLKSLAVSRDPLPNKLAIKSLEESVALDQDYAPAWTELGWRYYIDGHYAEGGAPAMAKSEQATRHAIALDPQGATNLVTIKSEQGDLKAAYEEARSLLERRPDTSVAHYEMSYVLRYAGLLDEAGQECDRALHIDPGYYLFRSCAVVFYLKADYFRAAEYIRVDEGSAFATKLKLNLALRQQNYSDASTIASQAEKAGFPWADLVSARLAGRPDAELAGLASKLEDSFKAARDPEDTYEVATALSFAGQSAAAARLLRISVEHHYCSYPAMINDPLLESVRQRPEFKELQQAGARCQQDFLAYR